MNAEPTLKAAAHFYFKHRSRIFPSRTLSVAREMREPRFKTQGDAYSWISLQRSFLAVSVFGTPQPKQTASLLLVPRAPALGVGWGAAARPRAPPAATARSPFARQIHARTHACPRLGAAVALTALTGGQALLGCLLGARPAPRPATPLCPPGDNTPLSASPRVSPITRPKRPYLCPSLLSPEKGQNLQGAQKRADCEGEEGPGWKPGASGPGPPCAPSPPGAGPGLPSSRTGHTINSHFSWPWIWPDDKPCGRFPGNGKRPAQGTSAAPAMKGLRGAAACPAPRPAGAQAPVWDWTLHRASPGPHWAGPS